MAEITESEIARIAALMKIDAGDAAAHVPKVQKMLEYFERLDSADMGDGTPEARTMSLDELRADGGAEPPAGLMAHLKGDAGEHVRSPDLK